MKIKTLLISAATLAAGVVSSQATSVYSQNVVGYVNTPLANGVLSCVSPALDLDGTGTNNTVSSVFSTPSIGDTVYAYNTNTLSYDGLVYTVQGSGRPVVYTTNWFEGLTVASNYPINPGQSVFYLPVANETNTQVGQVLQGTNLLNKFFPAANTINLLSSQFPIAGGLTSVLGYQPTIGDTVYVYDNGAYDGYQYTVQGTGRPVVYTTNWFNGLTPGEPVIQVGQGFWLLPAANTNWSQTLNVQ